MIKDYVIEILDSDNIILKRSVLTEMCNFTELELEDLIPSHLKNENILLIREPDADYEEERMVDCSTYFLKIQEHYISLDETAKELFNEVRTIPEYIKRYESY